jgi:hypothetical protein
LFVSAEVSTFGLDWLVVEATDLLTAVLTSTVFTFVSTFEAEEQPAAKIETTAK